MTKIQISIEPTRINAPKRESITAVIGGLILIELISVFSLKFGLAGNLIYTLFLITLIVRACVQIALIKIENDTGEEAHKSAVRLLSWYTGLNYSLIIGLVALAICVLSTWSFSLYWFLSVICFTGLIGLFLWVYGIIDIIITKDAC